jgi:hypothetical protein
MWVGKAYAAGLGTTGLLIASSILLLALVGALMAFDGEDGSDRRLPIDSIVVAPPVPASGSPEGAPAAVAGRREDGTERGRGSARTRRGGSARAPGSAGPGGAPAPASAPDASSGAAPPAAPVMVPAPVGAGETVGTVVGQVAPAPGQDVVQGVSEHLP